MKSWFKPDSWAILFGMMNFWLLNSHGLIKVIKQTTNGSWKNKIRCYIILCCLLRLVKSRKSKQLIREFVFFIVMWNLIISNFVWKLKNFGYYSDAWEAKYFYMNVFYTGVWETLWVVLPDGMLAPRRVPSNILSGFAECLPIPSHIPK